MRFAGLVRRLKARTRRERALFWLLALIFFPALMALAFTPPVGFVRPDSVGIPEVIVWDLNPVLWFPYYLAGHPRVGIDVLNDPLGRTLPPQAFPDLLFATVLFWAAAALVLSRILVRIVMRRRTSASEGHANLAD